jgi:hypothetical protein
LQRNKKLAHKIKMSQTTKNRKGQKKNIPEPSRRKQDKRVSKGKGNKKNENSLRDWSWGSFN